MKKRIVNSLLIRIYVFRLTIPENTLCATFKLQEALSLLIIVVHLILYTAMIPILSVNGYKDFVSQNEVMIAWELDSLPVKKNL